MAAFPVMQGFPPRLETLVTPENWEDDPFARWGQIHTSRLFPTARVYRGGGPASGLERRPHAIAHFKFENPEGETVTIERMLRETETDGFLVLHEGEVVYEGYFNGMRPETQHISQSISKSMIGIMAGILWNQGQIDLDAKVTHYVPELEASPGYRDATVRQNLDMTAGTQFREDPADLDSEWNRLASAAGIGRKIAEVPDSMYAFLQTMELARPHGEVFRYVSSNCEVLAWVIQRITGQHLPDLVSEWIWSRLGAEQDAYFAVDQAGMPVTHGLFNAALRDYARFGQMMLQDGFYNGQQIIPAEWVRLCRQGDRARFAASASQGLFRSESAYTNFWWVVDQPRGIITALGFRGQFIYIDPNVNMVIAKLSSLPSREVETNNRAYLYAVLGFRAIAEYIT